MLNCGLIVGKFSPLHNGHVHAISTARALCDHLIILSYSEPEFPGCDGPLRERWLKALFPDSQVLVLDSERLSRYGKKLPANDAPADDHRGFCAWVCDNLAAVRPDAVFSSEDYGEGFAAALSSTFGKTVQHVGIDRPRVKVPISATQIRSNIHAQRKWLPPVVYADFVESICLLGAESTGKTTLAMQIAEYFSTSWVSEYGRALWIEKGGNLDFADMETIGQTQVRLEDETKPNACRYLICDTSPLTTCFYSEVMFGKISAELQRLGERRYNQIFLCLPDFPLVQDGTRQDEKFRRNQHEWYLRTLERQCRPYVELGGPVKSRLRILVEKLRG